MSQWSRRHGWLALGISATCALTLAYLVTVTAQESNIGFWAKVLLVVIGGAALAATVLVSDALPSRGSWRTWLSPRPVAGLLLAALAVFSVETDLLSHFSPRPARESDPGIIERTARKTDARLAKLAARMGPEASHSQIGEHINRLWGEPGCAVAYRFRLTADALIIDAERRPPGALPYHLVGTVIGRTPDALTIVGEQPDTARGQAATFTWWTNGAVERLRWQDRARPVPLDLELCG